ncbi:MAG: hypothetical protein WAM82_12595 [Thermoanaerobaculia bacterium]
MSNEAVVGNLQQLLGKLEANKADLPQLEIPMTKLGTVMARIMDVNKQQGALTASKQAASKELQTLLTEGQRLANAMRALLKEHYGIRSEKLAEFGLQPFRGRVRTVKEATPDPATPAEPPTPAPHSTTG